MAGHFDDAWHNVQGNGIAYRPPPTVDEAIPYSPFTSIIPFSLDIIPFPSAEPRTPPSTLTQEQQQAAKRAVGILNDEINGQSTAAHLSNTLCQLKGLLDPEKLPEYNFKPAPQLATHSSESPIKYNNGTSSKVSSLLSPFAAMLLNNTGVYFTPSEISANETLRAVQPPKQVTPLPQPRAAPQTHTPSNAAYAQNASIPYPSSAISSAPNSTPLRPGPAVVIKPAAVKREEYQRIDNLAISTTSSQRKVESNTAILRPHEREIADRKMEELESYVTRLCEEKDDLDVSGSFVRASTADGEVSVLEARAMDRLSDKMANVNNLGHFAELPVDLIMQIQRLLEPSITYTGQLTLFSQDDDWSESIDKARSALQASKLILTSMIDGCDDYRLRPEDTVGVIIDLIKAIRNDCIMPVVQARRSDSLFDSASSSRKGLISILRGCGAVLSRFATLIGKVNLPERGLNVLEDLTVGLLVEQNSDSEKDSVFGIKPFESFRQKAMDVLAQIFARHAEQRPSILNGILSNLEKLPDKKASARQFKSAREVPIMSISALFMRFVQVAAMNRESRANHTIAEEAEPVKRDEDSDYESGNVAPQTSKKKGKSGAPHRIAQALARHASNIATTITSNLVDRASNVSKTGDKPFRNLLDLFIEDFCNVLGSPEWPAAAILLSTLLVRMVSVVHGDTAAKQSVVDKDMALSTIAKMGCGVIDFKHRLKQLKRALDASQSELSAKLDRLADDALTDNSKESINPMDLYEFDGPYRMVIESLSDYLELQRGQEDPHLESVTGCHVTLWLDAVVQNLTESSPDSPRPQAADKLQEHLEAMIMDPKWLDRKYKFQVVSENQAKLAAGIVTLQALVCQRLPLIVQLMLHYTRDKASSKLRSRGMTGLEQLIERNPRVVDEATVRSLVGSLQDSSPMVREHTLGLVSQCLEHEPSLERFFLSSILRLTADPSNGPKKKAIKLLKGLYLGPTSKENKLHIAFNLLLPSQDDEKAIAELSRGVLEELWLTPTASAARTDEHRVKLDRAQRANFMTDVVHMILPQPVHLEAFEKFFTYALSDAAKSKSSNTRLCKELVADLFDGVISAESTTGAKSSQAQILNTLSIFAKVDSTLFIMAQVNDLKLYIQNFEKSSELALVQPTVTILRYTIPTLPFLQPKFAEDVRVSLMSMNSKLANWAGQGHVPSRDTLTDVVHCLWIVSPMVDTGLDKLFVLMCSVLCQLRPLAALTKEQIPAKRRILYPLLILLGIFGTICPFHEHAEKFLQAVASYARKMIHLKQGTEQSLGPLIKGSSSVPLLLLESVRPFTMQVYDMDIREHAMRSLGGICQQYPELFMRAEVEKLIKLVFINQDNDRLKLVVLSTFEAYFTRAERRSETGSAIAVGEGAVNGSARLDSSYTATATDAATTHIAKQMLRSFRDVALKNNNELAERATNIISSISRAGLEHPKECGAVLVALATSQNPRIAQVAAVEHKRMHEKQESYLEKEYVQAVRVAFEYQRDIFNDPHGMLQSNHSPKLVHLFDALKGGKKATFKKFVDNLSMQLTFNLATLDVSGSMPDAVLFARFCLENLGLVDFTTLDMVASFIDKVEAIVLKDAGPLVAGEIDKEMPKPLANQQQSFVSNHLNEQLQAMAVDQSMGQTLASFEPTLSQPEPLEVSEPRLRQLTVACMILHMIWETRLFVRRCYNLHKYGNRIPQKEYMKPAQRNNFIAGKDLWDRLSSFMSALDSRDTMTKCCHDFSELLNVDREVKVGEDEDGLDAALIDAGYETPTENGDDARRSASIPTSGRGRKRKNNSALGNTPKKSRGRTQGGKNKKRSSGTPDVDDDSS
ncbi:Sister chromatid cohesion protein 2 [Ascochyta clinopodiicola]|nr:Sister chromatid cohesion protein 2 [Ascochyta clinopodiicola]